MLRNAPEKPAPRIINPQQTTKKNTLNLPHPGKNQIGLQQCLGLGQI
jgi:hypothetical protein